MTLRLEGDKVSVYDKNGNLSDVWSASIDPDGSDEAMILATIFQTEYSGMMYAMFWLGEYANILLMCAMGAILFLGGWMSPIEIYPFTLVPGAIWLILKILFLYHVLCIIYENIC